MSSARLKLSLALFFGATLLGLSWAFHQRGSSLAELSSAWSAARFSPLTIAMLAILSASVYFADALRYRVFARAFGIELPYRSCLRSSIGCLLFSWISPGASFGAPAASYLLTRAGLSWEDALLVSFGKSLSSSFLLLLLSLGLIALGYLPQGARSSSSVFLLLCLAAYVALLVFTPSVRTRARRLARAGVGGLAKILMTHLLYFAIWIGIIAVLALALGAAQSGRTYAISTLYATLLYMSPTPSGSGIAEASAAGYFGGLIGASNALLLTLLFRGVTYYAQIAFGAVYFLALGARGELAGILAGFRRQNVG